MTSGADDYQRWLPELDELVRIPTIGADPAHAKDMIAAVEWLRARFEKLGASVKVETAGRERVLIADISAQKRPQSAPTILIYGHYDVQPPGDLSRWESPPFETSVRDGWLYGRGVIDDKGHLVMYLEALRAVTGRGALTTNVRFLIDGAEESGGVLALDCLRRMTDRLEGCLIFDGPMIARGRPAFFVGARGVIDFHLHARTAERDLHSGQFGGAAMNAVDALMTILSAAKRGANGLPPDALRVGAAPLPAEDVAQLSQLPEPLAYLAEQGTHPADDRVGADMYRRLWAEPTFEIHGVRAGEPEVRHMMIPCEAQAAISMRLAPGQDPDVVSRALVALLEAATPAGARLTITPRGASKPALLPRSGRLLDAARDAFADVVGAAPLMIRAGGSLPLLSLLGELGLPTVMTGFDLPEGNIHAPNERLLLEHLPAGTAALERILSDPRFTQ